MSRTKIRSDSDVLDAAFDVIAREGFESFTFEQVGRVVGLSPAALVKRFGTKKNMALLARNRRWDRNLALLDDRSERSSKGLAGLFEFVKTIAAAVDSKRLGEHAKWLGAEAGHPGSRRKVARYFGTTRALLQDFVSEALRDGDLKGIDDPKEFAQVLEALIQGSIFQFTFMESGSIDSHLQNNVRLMLRPHLSARPHPDSVRNTPNRPSRT